MRVCMFDADCCSVWREKRKQYMMMIDRNWQSKKEKQKKEKKRRGGYRTIATVTLLCQVETAVGAGDVDTWKKIDSPA